MNYVMFGNTQVQYIYMTIYFKPWIQAFWN